MLFRNPTTGKTEDQIPTEAALKQYQEAAQRTRTQRNNEALVAGTDGEAAKTGPSGTGTDIGAEAKGDGPPAKVGGSFAAANVAAETSTGKTSAGSASAGNTSTGNRASPASGPRGTTVLATSSGGSAGNGSAGVRFNFVV
ncbi:conserved hypothetical protein [uncultured Gammaproteobacteria bacterium]